MSYAGYAGFKPKAAAPESIPTSSSATTAGSGLATSAVEWKPPSYNGNGVSGPTGIASSYQEFYPHQSDSAGFNAGANEYVPGSFDDSSAAGAVEFAPSAERFQPAAEQAAGYGDDAVAAAMATLAGVQQPASTFAPSMNTAPLPGEGAEAYALRLQQMMPGTPWEQAITMANLTLAMVSPTSAVSAGHGAGFAREHSDSLSTGGADREQAEVDALLEQQEEEEYADFLVSQGGIRRGTRDYNDAIDDWRRTRNASRQFEAGLARQGLIKGSQEWDYAVARHDEEVRLQEEEGMKPSSQRFRDAMEDWEADWYAEQAEKAEQDSQAPQSNSAGAAAAVASGSFGRSGSGAVPAGGGAAGVDALASQMSRAAISGSGGGNAWGSAGMSAHASARSWQPPAPVQQQEQQQQYGYPQQQYQQQQPYMQQGYGQQQYGGAGAGGAYGYGQGAQQQYSSGSQQQRGGYPQQQHQQQQYHQQHQQQNGAQAYAPAPAPAASAPGSWAARAAASSTASPATQQAPRPQPAAAPAAASGGGGYAGYAGWKPKQ